VKVLADGLFEVLVDLHRGVVVERKHLNHEDGRELAFGVDPEMRVEDARPGVAAGRPQVGVLLVRCSELKAKAKLPA
jgi:hypothetical protein